MPPQSVLPLGTIAAVKTSSNDTFTGIREPLHMLKASNGGAPGKTLLAVYGSTKVYGIGGTVAEPGSYYYPSNLYVDLTQATGAQAIVCIKY